MIKNWFWDIQLSESEIREILSNSSNPEFNVYAAKLFSRITDPKTAFNFVDKITFCREWPRIKKAISKDKWNKDKIGFWQTIYERVKNQLAKRGISIRKQRNKRIPKERMDIADQIREIRKSNGITQKDLASRLNVIQQYISTLESGKDNFSIDTLLNIAKALNKRLVVYFK